MMFRKFLLTFGLSLALNGQQFDYVRQVTNKPVKDIREYGAKGNGSADDTISFQTAISSCSGNPCVIEIPVGTYLITDTITIPSNITLEGTSEELVGGYSGLVNINFSGNGKPLFLMLGSHNAITNLYLAKTGATATSGTVGIYTKNGFGGGTAEDFTIKKVNFYSFYNGLIIDGCQNGTLSNVQAFNSVSDGIIGKGAQGYWTNVNAIANKGNGFTLGTPTAITTANPFINGLSTYANGGWGVYATENLAQTSNFFLNNDSLGEFYLNKSGGSLDTGILTNGVIQYAGDNPLHATPGYANSATAQGMLINGGTIMVTSVSFFNCAGNCIEVNDTNNRFTNIRIQGAGTTATVGSTYAIKVTGTFFAFNGGHIVGNVLLLGSNSIFTNTNIVNSASLPSLRYSGGTDHILSGNTLASYGAGTSLTVDSGVTLNTSGNEVIGTKSIIGTISPYAASILPSPLLDVAFASLPANPNMPAIVWCNNCQNNNTTCASGGNGASAFWNPALGVWICK